tara:strand:- start:1528 stop:2493 length:966 start_codon:yes stop_codon:yes gene_type:complete
VNKYKFNILVTGASGFIGKSLIKKLISMNYYVIGLVRKKSVLNRSPFYSEVLIDDIGKSLSNINISQIDIIIHLAAITHDYNKKYEDYLNTNVNGVTNIVNLGAKISAKLIIMLSSIKVNGEGFYQNNIKYNEKSIPQPSDFYGKSKLESENILIEQCKKNNISYVILRPPLIYGDGVKGNLLNLMKYIDRNIPMPIIKSKNIRSMLSINNLIEALVKIINNKNTHNDMYLISDNIPVSPKNLYNNISKNLNKKLYTFTINKYLLKIFLWPIGKSYLIDKISSSLIIDNTKIKKALKWTPSVSFDQEVKNMVKGYIKKSGK